MLDALAYREKRLITEPSDESLMALAKAGDKPAFERLVYRYEKPLYNYARRMLGNGADAEDALQETFLRLHQHKQRFRDGAVLRPWLYRIATNVCNDRLRYRKRHPQVSLDAPVFDDANAPTLGSGLAAQQPRPDEIAGECELAARLEAALETLDVKHRSVFLMARYEGLAYEEIAKSLRIPVGTVKSRMNKAVKFLMRAIGEEW